MAKSFMDYLFVALCTFNEHL